MYKDVKGKLGLVFFGILLCASIYPVTGAAQIRVAPLLRPGYYTVIAAYRPSRYDYARQHMRHLKDKGVNAALVLDKDRNYIYLYLHYCSDRSTSIAEMYRIRRTSPFVLAWVCVVGAEGLQHAGSAIPLQDATVAEDGVDVLSSDVAALKSEQEQLTPLQKTMISTHVDLEVKPNDFGEESFDTEMRTPDTVMVRLFQKENGEMIMGDVMLLDADRLRRLGKLSSDVCTTLPDPTNRSGMLTLEVDVFGYKPRQTNIPFMLTPVDTLLPFVSHVGNVYLITFYLERYARGELYAMDNVYFYNNAAIMSPGSEAQLNKLLKMMQDNPGYVIKFHGHTNGRAAGKLITMGAENNFFTLSDDVREGFGSARKLSRQRALTIKKWLVEHGISHDRIQTQAWGGSKMIYDQNRFDAYKNARVEVEILKQ